MADLFSEMMESPLAAAEHAMDGAFHFTPEQTRQFQDHWVAQRFADLRPKVAMLDKLAKEQGVETVNCVDDAVPLLLAHTVYKSYPMSYLENYRFDKLTKWMSGLTAVDLSRVDAKGIESIDDWIDELDAKTDLLVTHSSGTTGKLSFLPRTKEQSLQITRLYSNLWRDFNGANTGPDIMKNHMPMIAPSYRYGAGMGQRMSNINVQAYAGGEDNALFLYPTQRLSADVMSLSGRIRTAEAKGELGSLRIPEVLLRRRDDFIELEKQRPEAMKAFLETASNRFAGKDVYIGAVYTLLYDWAEAGLSQGQKNIFGANSFVASGGGKKGRALPDNFKQMIQEFLGLDTMYETYSMTEMSFGSAMCEEEHYHFPAMLVPYLLDPRTGQQLPRKDGTTGRLAFIDLMPDTFWAGFVTGDEVTAGGWEKPCKCGRTGFYVEPSSIRRYSEKEGGDDKVLCSGAPEAHDSAIAFLAELGR
jgi:acyl-CoA synthetase (AMP-forming)/AMP-acid ligase II